MASELMGETLSEHVFAGNRFRQFFREISRRGGRLAGVAKHHVAQLNVGRLLAPLDDPDTEGFVSALEPINALADRAPGFVWRLQTDEGDATAVRAYDDELMIVNYSIWESVESLKAFVFDSEHRAVLRQRREWFEVLNETAVVLWWVQAGDIPPIEEGVSRLEHLVANGPTPHAFTFRQPHDPPT
jgi:heme-degrading monooxygenase HmoA